MQIHELQLDPRKARKRIGRGGKRGTYSGRGNKGQKARSGAKIDPLFEGGRSSLVERLKKVRGFKSPHPKKATVQIARLAAHFSDGDTLSLQTLLEKGLITKTGSVRGVKIIGNDALDKKLTVDPSVELSAGALASLEKAGGKIVEE